jgi:hypothetical protein
MVTLLWWENVAGVMVTVILLGVARGSVTLIRPGMLADFYGRTHFGTINGWQTLVIASSRGIAPVAMGIAYTFWGGYPPVIWALAVISVASAVAMLRVRGEPASGLPAR